MGECELLGDLVQTCAKGGHFERRLRASRTSSLTLAAKRQRLDQFIHVGDLTVTSALEDHTGPPRELYLTRRHQAGQLVRVRRQRRPEHRIGPVDDNWTGVTSQVQTTVPRV